MEISPLKNWPFKLGRPLIISGPCSAESEVQVLETARELKGREAAHIFRAGIWKPRTRPNSFEGVGEKGLPWLLRVKKEIGLPTCTEVANASHVELALKHEVDILWIGARTTTSPFAVQELASALKGVDIPVMVKNPISVDIALWIGALERFSGAGISKLMAVHRGFSTTLDSRFRNGPNWKIPIELKLRFPELPIICDPSHIAGKRELIKEICQRAMDLDFDGLMIESHLDPKSALSDKSQQVTPENLAQILHDLSYKTEFSPDKDFGLELETLREKIDHIDYELLENLKVRMEIVKIIGESKRKMKITALQKNRIEFLLKQRMEKAGELGLSDSFIRDIFGHIHAESLKSQTEIISRI
ncbi:MAG: 3-deoxy-7-phosphoheptulonate synthase [Epsilonproteobacteria bacterium]|nr:MAG: 3-deoxy-7-phosphoheptulonate synthase [Campylobacterota bacterium]RLA66894.1 MAG: 3-deoxy-7-phosphoheptulonate synthase [Campylobacterota bacterium]